MTSSSGDSDDKAMGEQSESDHSSDSSTTSTSLESTTSASESSSSVPAEDDGKLLKHILQELSISLDSTATCGTGSTSKKSKTKYTSAAESIKRTQGTTLNAVIQKVITKSEEDTATKDSSTEIDTEDVEGEDSTNQDATEQEETEETTEQSDQDDSDETEQEDRDETEQEETEDTTEGEAEDDLIFAILREAGKDEEVKEIKDSDSTVVPVSDERATYSKEPEPEVIAPPSQSKKKPGVIAAPSYQPKKKTDVIPNPSSPNKNNVGDKPHQTKMLLATKPQEEPAPSSLVFFQNFLRCTDQILLKNVDDRDHPVEESGYSNAVAADKATKKEQPVPEKGAEHSVKANKSTESTVHSKPTKEVDPVTKKNPTPRGPGDVGDPLLPTNQPCLTVAELQRSLPASTSSAEGGASVKEHQRVLTQNYSMPVRLTMSYGSSKKATIRSVHSQDIVAKSEDTKVRQEMHKRMLSQKNHGWKQQSLLDSSFESLASSLLVMLQSKNDGNKMERENSQGCTLLRSPSPSGNGDASVETLAGQQQATLEMATEAAEDETTEEEADSSVALSTDTDDAASSQPVARLTRRFRSWTRKKKRNNKGRRRQAQSDSTPPTGGNTLKKQRRRRRKSKLFRSLANYVRSKPMLPVISEDPDRGEDESGDPEPTRDEENTDLTETDAGSAVHSAKCNGVENETDSVKLVRSSLDRNQAVEQLGRKVEDILFESSHFSQTPSYSRKETAASETAASDESSIVSKATEPAVLTSEVSANSMEAEKPDLVQAKQSSQTVQGKQLSQESIVVQHSYSQHPPDVAERELSQATKGLEQPGSPSIHGPKGETSAGTETLEMQEDAIEIEVEDPFGFPKTEIAEEEDGFCITMKRSLQLPTEHESAEDKATEDYFMEERNSDDQVMGENSDSCEISSRFSRSTKANKKSVHERIFDFLEKKPTWVESKKKHSTRQDQQASIPAPKISAEHQRDTESRRRKQSKTFTKSASFLKNIKGGAHGKRENSEVRDQPPTSYTVNEIEEDVLAPSSLPAAVLPQLQRWGSVEEKIDSSLKKAEALAGHYGEDLQKLLHQSNSRVEEKIDASLKKVEALAGHYGEDIQKLLHQSSSRVSVQSIGSGSLSASASQDWGAVEKKIDESLIKVERLANRFGIPREFLSSE